MHGVLMGILLLLVTVVAVGGVAGIATGWVVPWRRSRVRRPRLWGVGTLVSAAGAAVWGFVGPVAGPPHTPSAYVAWTGWILFMAGLLIQLRAQHPGRAPEVATKTSS